MADARPDVLAHNLETVPRLYPEIRLGADYARSLELLRRAAALGLPVKTSLMAGLGETDDELLAVLADARAAGATTAFLGQYLPRPRPRPPLPLAGGLRPPPRPRPLPRFPDRPRLPPPPLKLPVAMSGGGGI